MYEYLSEAVVLHAEPRGELDVRVHCFTRRYGKLSAKVKSARKVTSKLAGHLQPGNVVQLRVVEKGGLQLVDALKGGRLRGAPGEFFRLHQLLADSEPDPELWNHLAEGKFEWPEILRILGWDPRHGECWLCARPPHGFRMRNQEFYCDRCVLKVRADEVIYIHPDPFRDI